MNRLFQTLQYVTWMLESGCSPSSD